MRKKRLLEAFVNYTKKGREEKRTRRDEKKEDSFSATNYCNSNAHLILYPHHLQDG
jgi:hypothetical protein